MYTKMGGRTHSAVPLRPALAISYTLITLSRKSPQIKTPVDNSPPVPFKTNSYFVFFSVFVSAFFSVLASFASLASFSITAFSSW